MVRNPSKLLLRAVVLLAGVAFLAGCSSRPRYDCLIIKDLTGTGDVVASAGFPTCFSVDDVAAQDKIEPPAAVATADLMWTKVSIAVYGIDPAKGKVAVAAAIARVAELSKKLNNFDPDSEVSVINREAGRRAVEIDGDIAAILDQSIRVSRLTNGTFDVTVGPLTDLWRKSRAKGALPAAEEIGRVRELVGYEKLELTGKNPRSLKFARDGMSLDFGGIAKGFGSEEAAKVLVRFGVRSAVIACGGNIKLIGSRPSGKPFRVGIVDPAFKPTPEEPERLRFIVPLSDTCIDTSGNYVQFDMIAGKRYSHIVDPRTGNSIEALPSVTIVGPDACLCDGLTKGIDVPGVAEGLKLIDRVNAEPKK
jgi:thiamine biosynthesis lipoprotein